MLLYGDVRIECDMRGVLVQVNDMLHYTKSLMNYLSSQVSASIPEIIFARSFVSNLPSFSNNVTLCMQVSNTNWDDIRKVLETSESIATVCIRYLMMLPACRSLLVRCDSVDGRSAR